LKDVVRPPVRALFVGINPGIRSSLTGHHFAGFSNRFWQLLYESRLVPEPLTSTDDVRLPEWGYGVTNLVARPSPGIDDLRPSEYVDGWNVLEEKIRRATPEYVALVGVTLYRALLPFLGGGRQRPAARLRLGLQPQTIHGSKVVVLPNPSGRNANFSYDDMRQAFTSLARFVKRRPARQRRAYGQRRT
jgi:TDG/mug DNA glycosylase family protein